MSVAVPSNSGADARLHPPVATAATPMAPANTECHGLPPAIRSVSALAASNAIAGPYATHELGRRPARLRSMKPASNRCSATGARYSSDISTCCAPSVTHKPTVVTAPPTCESRTSFIPRPMASASAPVINSAGPKAGAVLVAPNKPSSTLAPAARERRTPRLGRE